MTDRIIGIDDWIVYAEINGSVVFQNTYTWPEWDDERDGCLLPVLVRAQRDLTDKQKWDKSSGYLQGITTRTLDELLKSEARKGLRYYETEEEERKSP